MSDGTKTRPGFKCVHRFRSKLVSMTATADARIICVLANGKTYISTKNLKRWRKITS